MCKCYVAVLDTAVRPLARRRYDATHGISLQRVEDSCRCDAFQVFDGVRFRHDRCSSFPLMSANVTPHTPPPAPVKHEESTEPTKILCLASFEANCFFLVGAVRAKRFAAGTPVLDIKPYIGYCDAFPTMKAGWLEALGSDHEAQGDYLPTFSVGAALNFTASGPEEVPGSPSTLPAKKAAAEQVLKEAS